MRKVWNPPLYYNGMQVKSPSFVAYALQIPFDDSPLSGKRIEIYFDANNLNFPFPYFAQVTDDSNASFRIHICDSGEGLYSPIKEMPRRSLHFSKPMEKTDEVVKIFLKSPVYYKNFKLHAIDQNSNDLKPIELSFEEFRNGEELEFKVLKSNLQGRLEKGHNYTLLIICEKPIFISLETKEIL